MKKSNPLTPELAEQEALALKTTVYRKVAHEGRNLRAVINARVKTTQQLVSDLKVTCPNQEEIINSLSEQLFSINYSLQYLTTIEDYLLHKTIHEAFDIIEEITHLCKAFTPKTSETEITLLGLLKEGKPLLISAIKATPLYILTNLLKNSEKFKHETRPLKINISLTCLTEELLELTTQDNGSGFTKEATARCFEEKASNEAPVMNGIGLPSIASYIRHQKGSIKLKSTLGEGSTFTIALPFKKTHTLAPNDPINKTIAAAKEILILLVDDEHTTLRLLTRNLTLLREGTLIFNNIKIFTACNKETALACVHEKRTLGAHFNLVITDLNMPGGDDGFHLAQEISELYNDAKDRSPKLALLSATQYTEEQIERFEKYFDKLLNKPINRHNLRQTLTELLYSQLSPAAVSLNEHPTESSLFQSPLANFTLGSSHASEQKFMI